MAAHAAASPTDALRVDGPPLPVTLGMRRALGREVLRLEPRDAEDARPGVRPDDGTDLRHEQRVVPEERATAGDERLRLLGRLDVLDHPRRRARGVEVGE